MSRKLLRRFRQLRTKNRRVGLTQEEMFELREIFDNLGGN